MKTIKQNLFFRTPVLFAVLAIITGSFIAGCTAFDTNSTTGQTSVYMIRHAEIDKSTKAKPLNQKGHARAQTLVSHLSNKQISHVYATHNNRTHDTLVPLANNRKLSVMQFPAPGSVIKGNKINNRSKGKLAIKPMIKAIRALPKGSSVVVAANSGNLYAIMAGLGVSVRESCKNNSNDCLPCKNKSCFPKKQFNNIWTVMMSEDKANMSHSTYGN